MIGSPLYVTISRPDIMFRVCLGAQFQANPREVLIKLYLDISRELLILAFSIELKKNTTYKVTSILIMLKISWNERPTIEVVTSWDVRSNGKMFCPQ